MNVVSWILRNPALAVSAGLVAMLAAALTISRIELSATRDDLADAQHALTIEQSNVASCRAEIERMNAATRAAEAESERDVARSDDAAKDVLRKPAPKLPSDATAEQFNAAIREALKRD